jgi:RNA polymerase-binding transcription factor DksA
VLVSDLGDSGTEEFDVEPDAEPSIATTSGIDLDEIQRDLEGVQTALERLNEGTYWTDEITGGLIPHEILDAFPLTRTVAGNTAG